jgi:hypothetical protein
MENNVMYVQYIRNLVVRLSKRHTFLWLVEWDLQVKTGRILCYKGTESCRWLLIPYRMCQQVYGAKTHNRGL